MHEKFRIRFGFFLSDNRKSKACTERSRSIQNLKWAGLFAIVVALTVCGARAEAQQPAKVAKIGLLGARPAASSTGLELFRQEFRKFGYIEGKNLVDGEDALLPALQNGTSHAGGP